MLGYRTRTLDTGMECYHSDARKNIYINTRELKNVVLVQM